ncbi:MAG: NAD(P)H-dependent glycerol-3-phosphate dehydrogenase [Candidatus Sericytochromatia bacterium]|nr:NAD(P)H-dependent glycerol-3-phosphate dehydrogenase [Candidatus Sericytochromatia bacterium]
MAREPVAVVGGGSWGTAIAQLLGQEDRPVRIWLRDAALAERINTEHRNPRYLPEARLGEGVVASTNLAEVVGPCRTIFLVVPSKGLREVARSLADHVDGDRILIHATKGLEGDACIRMSQVLREETCCRRIGVLSGPNLAGEIAAGHPAATVIASRYAEVVDVGREALVGPRFRVYASRDVVGTEWGGVLKNVVAIAAGVSHGLGFGMNTMAMLVTRGLAEMTRFGLAHGAEIETFQGLSGIGDLVATAFSPLSRNYRVGVALAEGQSLDAITEGMTQVAEGVRTTRLVHALAQRSGIYMPIVEAVHRLLFEGVSPDVALADLMAINRNPYEAESVRSRVG